MYELTHENQGSKTFLVYQLKKDEQLDTFTYGMLSNNKIKGVLPILLMQMNEEQYVKYDISSKVSLQQFLSGMVRKNDFLISIMSVVSAILDAEEYMIQYESFLLDPNQIYVDVTTGEASIISMPLVGVKNSMSFSMFCKQLLFNTQFDQREDTSYVAYIINYLNQNSNLSLVDFKGMLMSQIHPATNGNSVNMAKQPEVKQQQNQIFGTGNVPVQSKPNTFKAQSMVAKDEVITKKEAAKPVEKPIKEKANPMNKQPQNLDFAIPGMDGGMAIPGMTDSASKDKKSKKEKAPKQHKEKKKLFSFGKKKKDVAMQPPVFPEEQVAPMASNDQGYQLFTNAPGMNQTSISQSSNPSMQNPQMGFGETTVLNQGAGETMVLNESMQSMDHQPHLLRKKNSQHITVGQGVFRIGKDLGHVDYCIEDNAAISRCHATIMMKNNGYVIIDNNSTNHTYVDGIILAPNEEKELHDGSNITLGNEEFTFYIQ